MLKLKKVSTLLSIVMILSLLCAVQASASFTFYNPRDTVNQRPDPFVYKHTDGYYYGVCTAQDSTGYLPKIVMWKSTSLVNLYTSGTSKTIWTAPSSGWNSSNI